MRIGLLCVATISLSLACGPDLPGMDETDGTGDEAPAVDEIDSTSQGLVDCAAARVDRGGTYFPAITRSQVIANANSYRTFAWTPASGNLANPTGRRSCGYTMLTSGAFSSGVTVYGFPYKKAGYDSKAVFTTCKTRAHPSGIGLYLTGTVTLTSVARSCGVLGLDCAGFVGKAFGVGDNEYTTPSFINGACPAYAVQSITYAKPGDILKRYSSTATNNHFMIVESKTTSTITYIEEGSVFSTQKDRVRRTTTSWTDLVNAGFKLCKPNGILEG